MYEDKNKKENYKDQLLAVFYDRMSRGATLKLFYTYIETEWEVRRTLIVHFAVKIQLTYAVKLSQLTDIHTNGHKRNANEMI